MVHLKKSDFDNEYPLQSIQTINSFLLGQNGRHFADIFKRIFMNENFSILIEILLNFVFKGPIDNKSTLVQALAWCRTGDKPLPEPMMT